MDKVELTQIVKKVQADKEQFELLYVQIINRVYFWCYTLVGNESQAKDLAQESMIRIYQKIHTVKDVDGFIAWTYVLVRNICNSYLRSCKNDDKLFSNTKEFTEDYEQEIKDERRDNVPNEAYDLKETKKLIIEFINNLPKKQKEVIILFYLEEYKIEEIAKILNYNVGSVKSRLHSGRKNLEQQISKYQEENNLKLYSMTLLPLLGLLLLEYREELCAKQDLHFDKSLYQGYDIGATGLWSDAMRKIGALLLTATLVGGIMFGLKNGFPQFLFENQNIDQYSENSLDTTMYDKIKGNYYIKSVSYMDFPLRKSVEISIHLKREVIEKDIHIFFDGEEIAFKKQDKILLVEAIENGNYQIVIKDMNMNFKIDVLDPYAPELIEVQKHSDYLHLVINDEKMQLDYKKSYVEYEGKMFKISEQGNVYGEFEDGVGIKLFTKEYKYIKYDVTFDE